MGHGAHRPALCIAFVFYSFKPAHPLLDLRLFRNYNLSISTITMFLFAAAFFGGLLLVPTYFQNVRGETPLQAAEDWMATQRTLWERRLDQFDEFVRTLKETEP